MRYLIEAFKTKKKIIVPVAGSIVLATLVLILIKKEENVTDGVPTFSGESE